MWLAAELWSPAEVLAVVLAVALAGGSGTCAAPTWSPEADGIPGHSPESQSTPMRHQNVSGVCDGVASSAKCVINLLFSNPTPVKYSDPPHFVLLRGLWPQNKIIVEMDEMVEKSLSEIADRKFLTCPERSAMKGPCCVTLFDR